MEQNTIHHGGEISLEDAQTQARDIMGNPDNPLHEKWKKGEAEALDHVDRLYRKAVGNAPVQIGGGSLASSAPTLNLAEFSVDPNAPPVDPAEEFMRQQDEKELTQLKEEWERDGIGFESATQELVPLVQAIHRTDPELLHLAEARLGPGLALRLLKIISGSMHANV